MCGIIGILLAEKEADVSQWGEEFEKDFARWIMPLSRHFSNIRFLLSLC
jgi:hypothetical protein